jgi:excinuclease UvrABC nuclease subunit
VLPLDCGVDFDAAREEDFFAALPSRPAVFVVEMREAGAHLFLARSADLRRRLERLLRPADQPTKRLNLREIAARVRYRLTGSPFEQSVVIYEQARQIHSSRYRAFLRLRPAALLKLNFANAYPRCYVTRRILPDGAFYFGPFPSRKSADAFSNEFLNLFRIRRCQIKIRRDPSFPGCIYSEMKMCLAPCFAGCTKSDYDLEVARVADFLSTCGSSLVGALERERESASEALDFERASSLHKRIERVSGVLRGLPDLPRHLEKLDAVLLQRAAGENTIAVFVVRGGLIADPFLMRFADLQSQPRSLEQLLREQLLRVLGSEAITQSPKLPIIQSHNLSPASHEPQTTSRESRVTNHVLEDHLSLLARWFYGKPRLGDIFFPQPEWPYRRMIRACSRLLTPSAVPESTSPPTVSS